MSSSRTLQPRGFMARLALLGLALALAACTTAPRPERAGPLPLRVSNAALDPDVFRVTVLWPEGEPPPEREALLLERCAELTKRAGARYFFIVNASEPIAHAQWLKAGAIVAPTLVIPQESPGAGGILSAVIRVFRAPQAPEGYPLYDAERILRERRRGVAAWARPASRFRQNRGSSNGSDGGSVVGEGFD